VKLTSANPGEALAQMEAKKAKVLASAEALKYCEEVFRNFSGSKIWKEKYIGETMLTPDHTTSAETYTLREGKATCTPRS
jgi:hypothetical protein